MQNLQRLIVNDTYRLHEEDPIMVTCEDEINQVIENFADRTELSVLFVVEDEGCFAGVITRTDLLDWARVNLGAALIKPLKDVSKTLRLAALANTSTVSDIIRKETIEAAVLPDDTLADALRTMIEADLAILPVINEDQHVIGSLTLSEMLNRAMGESQA